MKTVSSQVLISSETIIICTLFVPLQNSPFFLVKWSQLSSRSHGRSASQSTVSPCTRLYNPLYQSLGWLYGQIGWLLTLPFWQWWAVFTSPLLPKCLVCNFHHCPCPTDCYFGFCVSGLVNTIPATHPLPGSGEFRAHCFWLCLCQGSTKFLAA